MAASLLQRAPAPCMFRDTYGLRVPILVEPMAGACQRGFAAAVANTG
jgi:hypothetical protein